MFFTVEETNLMCCFDTSSRSKLISEMKSNRQLSPTLPDSPTHDKITPTIPAKWNGLRWST